MRRLRRMMRERATI
ncbi:MULTISPECIES: hypothetical protein [Caulobacter]|nr:MULTISPECIES: hypothetical protein [Caulobacter]MBQ1561250.1 hypothetical protein [Caulobacter sp.]